MFGAEISPEFFQSVNPFSIIVLAPVFALVWIKLGDRGPGIGQKFATGLLLAPAAGQAITAQLVQATEGGSDTAYFGGLAVVTIAFALILYFLSPWIRRHTDVRQTS